MGLTSLPIRGSGQPLGPTKSDARTATDLTRELASSEWNVAAKALEEVCAEVGLASGATVGSLVYLLKNLGGVAIPGQIAVGTWTPTAVSVANLDATPTPQAGHYLRVGSIVVAFTEIQGVDPTTGSTSTEYTLTPPIASNFATTRDVVGFLGTTFTAVRVFADTTNDVIRCLSLSSGTTAVTQYVLIAMKVL